MSQVQLGYKERQESLIRDSDSLPRCSPFGFIRRFSLKWPLRALLGSMIVGMAMFSLPQRIPAQRLELSGGWAHVTQNFGTDGFDAGAAWWFTPKITLAANYDGTWDTSQIGVFQITNVGLLVSLGFSFSLAKSRNTNWACSVKRSMGVSHINSTFQQVQVASVSSSDTAFTWTLGGGADIRLRPIGQRVETSISCARILRPRVRAALGLFSESRTPLEGVPSRWLSK
jgi:hypothetical protein